jgi:hypothetical protein
MKRSIKAFQYSESNSQRKAAEKWYVGIKYIYSTLTTLQMFKPVVWMVFQFFSMENFVIVP